MSSESGAVDAATIEKTKQQIRSLVSEISQYSRQADLSPEQFYAEVMQRIVAALAAIGGAVWTITEDRRLKLEYQINLSQQLLDQQSEDAQRHLRLLQEVITTGESRLIPALSGAGEESGAGNPTNSLLVLAPVQTGDQAVEGVLEVFQRPDSQPGSHAGYVRFLNQMCELVADWLKSRKLRHFSDRQSLWAQIDHFAKEVHNSLEVKETAYTIANEGRRLVGCDRVSVALRKGNNYVIQSISGQDTLDSRSNVVAMLRKLSKRVCATGEPLWYNGSTEDLPPQVEEALNAYVDESHTKSVAVLPLRKLDTEAAQRQPNDALGGKESNEIVPDGEVIGALIVEHIESAQSADLIRSRVDLVCQHSARALGNAIEHDSLFLMPVWRTIGRARWLVQARTLPKTLLFSGLALAGLIALCVIPAEMELEARGELRPINQHRVYALEEGHIKDIPVEDNQQVGQDQVLIELENLALTKERDRVEGEKNKAESDRRSIQERYPDAQAEEQSRLMRDFNSATITYRTNQKLLKKLDERIKHLKITSPASGRVATFKIDELKDKPVRVGERVLTVYDSSGPWELVLYMDENRLAHFNRAKAETGEDLPVRYILRSTPKVKHQGTVKHIHGVAEYREELKSQCVKLRVEIDENDLDDPLPGTTVIGHIRCGKKPMGYVWFHRVWEWLQVQRFRWF